MLIENFIRFEEPNISASYCSFVRSLIGVRTENPKFFASVARYWPRNPSIGLRYGATAPSAMHRSLSGMIEIGVELHLHPEPVALLAGPERAVEREHPGLEFLERHPADRAGHEGRVGGLLTGFIGNEHEPFGLLQAVLHRLGKPGLVGGVEPVDHDLDVLHLVPVELDLLVGPDDLPVDPDPGEPFLVEIF